ncbi:radical SAM family heme chaperone HemW [Chryseobacterium sp.]|uniref:radical SAM family heme chaperone HemW n=1 Tax=Chryseobacterium sp. TaxID=1871047 RepID=UPI0012A90793|nr:radical SAM family heme chaperone HemW [Chryseobacterium sp.]QFG52472.1 radical SAM family heme chaperone HemW [Chryseobacterium sp.]
MIYLHIPFCKQKCSYCNFHFSTSLRGKEEMLQAIKKELFLRKEELDNKVLKSLYFGGGTPSVLTGDEIKGLIDEVLRYYSFADDIEITLEANPDDLDGIFVKELSSTAINRLSIGTQSFFDDDLRLMNRAHNASEADASIKRAQDYGFENLSIDLIYGSPTSSLTMWKENLNRAVALQVPHISSYALTVEPKTALENWVRTQKITAPAEEEQNEEFHYMCSFLKENGFEHYEISNFAKPGFHSRHNAAYWQYEPYLGIGPSAHSYDGLNRRSWNAANNAFYIKNLEAGILPAEAEHLQEKDRFNEMLMIGLRTVWGVDLHRLSRNFSPEILQGFNQDVAGKISEGILKIEKDHLLIPEEHWFMADGIASDLFVL